MTNKEIGARIKAVRKNQGKTLDDIADAIGMTKSTIQRYETGKIESLKLPVLSAIADVLHVNDAWLVGKSDEMYLTEADRVATIINEYDNLRPIATKRFPLLSTVACGDPILMQDEQELYVDAATDIRADFVLKAKGDSMIGARIYDGDYVFIRSQPMVENGEIAAVGIGDEATLKRVYWYANKTILVLRAENPKYPDMEFSGEQLDDVRIFGKAVAFQSDVR